MNRIHHVEIFGFAITDLHRSLHQIKILPGRDTTQMKNELKQCSSSGWNKVVREPMVSGVVYIY